LIVDNGRVIVRGGGGSAIPANGFVMAGWGPSALWLNHWGMIGAQCVVNGSQVTITVDAEAWFQNAQYYLNLAGARGGATATLAATLAVASAERDSNPAESWQLVSQVIADAKELLYTTAVSPEGEIRGVIEVGIPAGSDLSDQIVKFKSAGVNTVMALKSLDDPNAIADIKTAFAQYKASGLAPILWTFLPMNPIRSCAAILTQHPDWQDIDKGGHTLGKPDTACSAAMDWWCGDTADAVASCELDGIMFDYEGYNGGYSECSRQGFIAQEGLGQSFDPKTLNLANLNDPLVCKWLTWLRGLIINAGNRLSQSARAARPQIQVVGCVASDSSGVLNSNVLNVWPDWLDMGTFDAIQGMFYAQNAKWVGDTIQDSVEMINGRCASWPALILYPETGGSSVIEPELLIDQVEAARLNGAEGVFLFMGEQFMSYQGPSGDDIFNCLRDGLFCSSVGLVAHWKLDDGSPSPTAADSSGFGHPGTLRNGPAWTTGRISGGLTFDASNDYVVADNIGVSSTNTVTFWMKWNGGNAQMPFGWNGAYDLYFYSGFFGINTGQGNILGISAAGMANQWVHVTMVFPNGVPSASNAKLFINGVQQTVTDRLNPTTASRNATPKIFISGWGQDSYQKFGGVIDDVRIYNRELTLAEVQAAMNSGE
jgi:hypothetical protein